MRIIKLDYAFIDAQMILGPMGHLEITLQIHVSIDVLLGAMEIGRQLIVIVPKIVLQGLMLTTLQ
jgi:hypothetical protein